MQVGNWVAEESAQGQERKVAKAEAVELYHVSATEETEPKMPCELVGWKKKKTNKQTRNIWLQ